MSTFPRLKTGAVAQYPAGRTAGYATAVFRFLDGSEQRFRDRAEEATRWTIELDLLDDTEMAQICEFFEAEQGRFGTFTFVDPWDASVHPNCSFEDDELTLEMTGEARAKMRLVIKENKD